VPHKDVDDAASESSDDRLLSARADASELGPEMSRLRPHTLAEFVGQASLKRRLRVYVSAARERGEALDHTLFHGPPGLGKTTLGRILAAEMGVHIHETTGPAVEHKGVLAGHLTALGRGDMLFIDEIHRLTPTVEESLYSAMEDGVIDLAGGQGTAARSMRIPIPPFTLVGATTRLALLTPPLRERFQIVEGIDFYPADELTAIVERNAALLRFPTTATGAVEIGRRARGTPRIANKLLRRIRDFAQDAGHDTIDQADAAHGLAELGVDGAGLDATDRKLLATIIELFDGGPVGIDALAATLNLPRDTLEDLHEPFLLQCGLIVRTPRGRQATSRAYQHLGIEPTTSSGTRPGEGQGQLEL
jgi:Holliday junction DNA helicase RuvB